MTAFFDTSALVKLYVPETGHELVSEHGSPTISEFTRVEMPLAIWRKHRMGDLDHAQAASLAREFEADYYGSDRPARFTILRLSDPTMERAAGLLARADLRAGDAIQLASALVARQFGREVTTFAAFDARLRDAAAVEGFALLPTRLAA